MVTLQRRNGTNLYIISGLDDPHRARFLFVVPLDSTLPELIEFKDTYGEGFYAFIKPPSSGKNPFLEAGEELLQRFVAEPNLRIAWFSKVGKIDERLFADMNGVVQVNAEFEIKPYSLSIPGDSLLRAGDQFLEIRLGEKPLTFGHGGNQLQILHNEVDIKVVDGTDANGSAFGVSLFEFELTVGGDDSSKNDFDLMDAGLRYFRAAGDGANEFLSRRFAIFRPFKESSRQVMTASIDVLHPQDRRHTYISFGQKTPGETLTIGSFFRATNGKAANLSADNLPRPIVENGKPRLIFAHRISERGQLPTDSNAEFYLCPIGRFKVDSFANPTENANHAQQSNLDLPTERFLCGNSGAEYVAMRADDELMFVHDMAAFWKVPNADSKNQELDANSGLLTKEAITSWVSLNSSGEESPWPNYRAQPNDAPLYTSVPFDPDRNRRNETTSSVLSFQQIPLKGLDAELPFPMVSPAGFRLEKWDDSNESAIEDYVQLETQALHPTRRLLLKPDESSKNRLNHSVNSRLDPSVGLETVTPQGLKVSLDASLEWGTMLLGLSEPGGNRAPKTLPIFQLHDVGKDTDLFDALSRNKVFVVMDQPPETAVLENELSIRGWRHIIELSGDGALLLFKFYDQPVIELANDTSLWAQGGFLKNASQAQKDLQEFINRAVALADTPENEPFYANIRDKLLDPNWNGILAINTKLSDSHAPEGFRALLGAIQGPFRSHHVGINASRFDVAGGKIDIERTSLFGLVDYCDPKAGPNCDRDIPAPNDVEDFSYRIKQLRILFENSAIANFSCDLRIFVRKIFKQDNSDNVNDAIKMTGSYERRGETDIYAFTIAEPRLFNFDPRNQFISEIRIDKVLLGTGIESLVGDDERVTCKIGLFGQMKLGGLSQKWLCIERVHFSELGVELSFLLPRDKHPEHPRAKFLPGLIRFDLANYEVCSIDTETMLQGLPIDPKSFYFSSGDVQISLPELGFFPSSFFFGNEIETSINFDYGLSFTLDLGSLGGLLSVLKDFKMDVLLGWTANNPTQPTVGIRLPDGRKEIGIQGVMRLIIEDFKTRDLPSVNGKTPYAILLKGCVFEFLGARLPAKSKDKINIFLFPNPEDPLGSKVGWWGSISEQDKYLIGLGQRISIQSGTPPRIDEIVKLLRDFPPASSDPDVAEEEVVSDLVDILNTEPDHIRYDLNNEWSAAFDLVPIKGLRLAAVFNDPTLYGARIELLNVIPGGAFSLEIVYKKVTDEIGVYATDIGLPSSIREIEMGAISVTLPNVGIEIFTNGDWRVDLGFPAGLDFRRSFKVQAFPFIGAGGFYLGRLSGATTTMVPAGPRDVVAVVGFGMRIGLGKEMEKGIFRFGVSVTLYGILEGAFAYEPGNKDPFSPDALAIVGRVGILAQLYGEVDFGIVKASVVITIEVGMPFLIRNPGPSGGYCISVPYVEANVSVRVTVVVGRIKTFLGTVSIEVSYSFSTRIRLPLPIGDSACGQPPEVLKLSRKVPQVDVSTVDFVELARTSKQVVRSTNLRDLVFHFVPAMTVTKSSGVQRPEIVANLGVHHGDSNLPTADFDYMVEAFWLLMLQTASGGSLPERVTLRDLDERGLDKLLRQPSDLDGLFEYAKLATFLEAHFNVLVHGIDGPEEMHKMAHFPMIPDLMLEAESPSLVRDFKTHHVRDAGYEKLLESFFSEMFVNVENQRKQRRFNTSTSASVCELLFERYFRNLATAANQMYLQRLEDAAELDPNIAIDGVLLTAPAGTHSLLREPPPIPSRYGEATTFSDLAGQVTNTFNSGLRLPFDSSNMTSTGLYELSGQQFIMSPLPGSTDPQEFPVRLKERTTGLWFDVGNGVDAPEVGEDAQNNKGIDLSKIETLTQTQLPGTPSRSDLLPPILASPKRFGFPDGMPWKKANNENPAIVWPIPPNLRETIDELDAEDVLAAENMRVRMFRAEATGIADVDHPDTHDPVSGHWAVRVPLTVRQVANPDPVVRDGAPDPARKLAYTYEIAGVSEPSRRRLDALLRSGLKLEDARLSILYQLPGKDNFSSDDVRGNADDCHVVLFRNNLSTDSRPGAGFNASQSRDAVEPPFVLCQASLAESENFIELMWFSSVVNSGGYYIRYMTPNDADPLADLFGGTNANKEAEITVLIEFASPIFSLKNPLRHPFVNCIVSPITSDPVLGSGKPLLDENANAPEGVPPFVLANVERRVGGVWHRIRQFQSVLEPGTVGFSVERDRLSGNDYVEEVDNLYSRLAFTAETPDDCRDIPNTLPLSPLLPQSTESNPKAGEQANVNPVFRFEHVLPIYKASETRYPAIGQQIDLSFSFRDVYGNELPCSGNSCAKSLPIQYFDELIPITEWPGIERNALKIVDEKGTHKLVLEFSFRKEILGLEGGSTTPEQKLRMRQRFERIFDQLNDVNLNGPEEQVVWVETSIEPGKRKGCRTVLRDFARDVLSYVNGGSEPAKTIEIDLGVPLIRNDDLFELCATLHFQRKPPKNVTEDEAFARRQREPWETSDPFFEPARRVTSFLSMPGSAGLSSADDALLAFARDFEEHLYNSPTDKRKLATGITRLGDRSLWVVRSQRELDSRSVPLLQFQDRQNDFAPAPLSNQLVSSNVVVPVRSGVSGNIQFKDSEKPFNDVDFDRLGRFCLESIEDFLAPANITSVICMAADENLRFGRQIFERVVASKAHLANLRLPNHLIQQLLDPTSSGVTKGRDSALAAFQQRLLTTLHSTYDLDAVPVFTGESCLNRKRVFSCRGAFEAEKINLFGRVVNRSEVDSGNPALKFEDAKIKLMQNSGGVSEGHVAVLIDARSATPERLYERDLGFELTHLEIVGTPVSGSPYESSTWVKFVKPETTTLRNKAKIPIPLREFPDAPQLEEHSHSAGLAQPDPIRSALAWTYEVTYRTRGLTQDIVDFEIELNQRLVVSKLAASGRTLFEAMTSFREAFPDPRTDYSLFRDSGSNIKDKQALLHQLAKSISELATSNLSTFRIQEKRSVNTEWQDFSVQENKNEKIEEVEKRAATVCWPATQDATSAIVSPVGDHKIGELISYSDKVCRETTFTETIQEWRRRLLRIEGLNIVRHENAQAHARIVRNENFDLAGNVNPEFIYRTDLVSLPHPLTPRIDVEQDIPIDDAGSAPIRVHLGSLLDRILENQPPGADDNRRFRIEVRFAFDTVVRIPSPELLYPPLEVSVRNPAPFIEELSAAIEAWLPTREPILQGYLIFDLMLFAELSDVDVPTLRLRNLTLQLSNIDSN